MNIKYNVRLNLEPNFASNAVNGQALSRENCFKTHYENFKRFF